MRILTNYYDVKTAQGMITPLDFLSIAGAQVRYYKTTTFMHAKYIQTDNSTVASSSVNYSYTSFMENREAGFIISGDGSGEAINFYNQIYNYDWNVKFFFFFFLSNFFFFLKNRKLLNGQLIKHTTAVIWQSLMILLLSMLISLHQEISLEVMFHHSSLFPPPSTF